MILINSQTKQPCGCKDCLQIRLQNAEWSKYQKPKKVDSVQKHEEVEEPWYNRI